MVNKIYDDEVTLYKSYSNKRKIEIKSVKYFKKPILSSKIKNELDFVKDKTQGVSNYITEYKEISKKDLKTILNCEILTNAKPLLMKNIKFDLNDFLLKTIDIIFNIEKDNLKGNQVEIKEIIKTVNDTINSYGIKLTQNEVESFYAENVWKLNYKHIPSRDPDKNITLYDASGNSRKFGYIEF